MHIRYCNAGFHMHALRKQPAHQGAHDGIKAVVARGLDHLEALQVREKPEKAQQVAPQFGGTVPRLKPKHAAPHEPKVRLEKVSLKTRCNRRCAQGCLGAQHQAHEVNPVLVGQAPVRDIHRSPLLNQSGPVRPRLGLPELKGVFSDRLGRVIQ